MEVQQQYWSVVLQLSAVVVRHFFVWDVRFDRAAMRARVVVSANGAIWCVHEVCGVRTCGVLI